MEPGNDEVIDDHPGDEQTDPDRAGQTEAADGVRQDVASHRRGARTGVGGRRAQPGLYRLRIRHVGLSAALPPYLSLTGDFPRLRFPTF